VAKPPLTRNVDRREFVNGRWANANDTANVACEIASILVQARPERLDEVAHAIEAMPRAQIYSRDARGKLVVVIEASDVGGVGVDLNTISLLPDVLSATLVFQGTADD
jgi:periplasmic nitrate reductase NapD